MKVGFTAGLILLLALAVPGLAQQSSAPPPPEKKKVKKVWTNDDFPVRRTSRPEARPAPTQSPQAVETQKPKEQKVLTEEECQERIRALEEDIRLTSEYVAFLRDRTPQESDEAARARLREEQAGQEEELARMRGELEMLRNPPSQEKKSPAARSTPPRPPSL